MKVNNELRFSVTTEFKTQIEAKIKQLSPDLKKTSAFKKIFLLGYYSLLDNLTKGKNLLEIPLKIGQFQGIQHKKEVKR
jgi:hypothetical protein